MLWLIIPSSVCRLSTKCPWWLSCVTSFSAARQSAGGWLHNAVCFVVVTVPGPLRLDSVIKNSWMSQTLLSLQCDRKQHWAHVHPQEGQVDCGRPNQKVSGSRGTRQCSPRGARAFCFYCWVVGTVLVISFPRGSKWLSSVKPWPNGTPYSSQVTKSKLKSKSNFTIPEWTDIASLAYCATKQTSLCECLRYVCTGWKPSRRINIPWRR